MLSNRLVEHAQSHCDCCWVTALKDENDLCKFEPPDEPSLCLCADKRFRANHERAGKVCDFVLFLERDDDQVVSPLEMKGANPDIPRARKQLQSGAEIAEDILGDFPPVRFIALLASRKPLRPAAIKQLLHTRVRFREIDYQITPIDCGGNLEEAILKGAV